MQHKLNLYFLPINRWFVDIANADRSIIMTMQSQDKKLRCQTEKAYNPLQQFT